MNRTFAAVAVCLITQAVRADLVDQLGRDLASPATTPARNLLYIGGALALTAAIFEDSVSDPIQMEATESRPLGHFATQMGTYAGRLQPNIAYVVGMAAYSLISHSESARSHAVVMTKSSVYAPLVTGVIKFIVQEPRPDGSDHYSFPSGHTTSAFSFASVIQAEHGWVLGSIAYAWASVVGYGRLNDNRHFLHDVLAGAVIGTSYGLGVHYRSVGSTESGEVAFIQVLPSDDLSGVVGIYTVRF